MNVLTLGTFDLLHYGHIRLLKKCREFAGKDGLVSVGLNTDEFIKKYKGSYPVLSYEERFRSIDELDMVNGIIPNDQLSGDAREVIKNSGADLIVIASDWGRKDYLAQLGINWDWLDRQGIGVCYVNYTHGISTTEIKRRLSVNH